MPTITCRLKDLNQLATTNLAAGDLEKTILFVKGEIKDYDPSTDELKIELQDTNRPDLWTVEGIARQLRYVLKNTGSAYPWMTGKPLQIAGTMYVDKKLDYRPFAGAIIARNIDVTDDFMIGLIQTQEKLANNLGRKRKSLSIGIYDLDQITFPVYYKAAGRRDISFVPLDMDAPMTPEEILKHHPKGVEYACTLEGRAIVPMLVDDTGTVMSFPPIINSRASGEVHVGRRNLFVEATGTDFMHLVLALNIFAADLFDRGAEIYGVSVHYDIDTPFGREVVMPVNHVCRNTIDTEMVQRWLGRAFSVQETADLLHHYGYIVEETNAEKQSVSVAMPSWRQDLLHPVDIMEDLAIMIGYDSFVPEMPGYFTVGKVAPQTVFEDRIRDIILAFGYEEVISNILCAKDEFTDLVREPDRPVVEIENPMNIKYAALRDRIMPSLLRIERDSSQAAYPHRIFETGEVTLFDSSTITGCSTRMHLAILIADREAEFSYCHSCLESLLFNLGLSSVLVQEDNPVFLPGRAARVTVSGNELGWIGEVHPEVLDNFGIIMPCAAFELDLDQLREQLDRVKNVL
jgi:phenylalanyl-tRNA synthetase beta chain